MSPRSAAKAELAAEERRREATVFEATWEATLAIIIALLLQLALPDNLVLGPRWVLPVMEAALLAPLLLTAPRRHSLESKWARRLAISLIALINVANVASLALLAYYLVSGGKAQGKALILYAIAIWLTNVILFSLWYWEVDRGGPGARTHAVQRHPDFLFPQMTKPELAPRGWRPRFLDYAYVSLTNAAAFSPTDTMPLTPLAKGLMGVQSIASLVTVALVAARAVNILS